jgi:hypothetical protein
MSKNDFPRLTNSSTRALLPRPTLVLREVYYESCFQRVEPFFGPRHLTIDIMLVKGGAVREIIST